MKPSKSLLCSYEIRFEMSPDMGKVPHSSRQHILKLPYSSFPSKLLRSFSIYSRVRRYYTQEPNDNMEIHRVTKETDIKIYLDMNSPGPSNPQTGLPFFDHILHSMAFHGHFRMEITAKGDLEVDPHHLVEDTGLVLGNALARAREKAGGITRFGLGIVPMDDALSEAVIDVGGRPYLVFNADWPQTHAGNFDLSLLREFWWGVAISGKMNIHLHARYAENAHHAAEAMFKAAGRALSQAYMPISGGEAAMSTKGKL